MSLNKTMQSTSVSKPVRTKIVFGKDIRRWRYPSSKAYASLLQFVQDAFGVSQFYMQFEDEERDRLTIATQQDFEDAVQCANDEARKSLKIYLTQGLLNKKMSILRTVALPCNINELRARFLADVNIVDGSQVLVNSILSKKWRLLNMGSVEWGNSIELVFLKGNKALVMNERTPVANCQPSQTIEVCTGIKVPAVTGHFVAYYRLYRGDEFFGPRLWIDIVAVDGKLKQITAKVVKSDVSCICGDGLVPDSAASAYNWTSWVICDICERKCYGATAVYHCSNAIHPKGYDLCGNCYTDQKAFRFGSGAVVIPADEETKESEAAAALAVAVAEEDEEPYPCPGRHGCVVHFPSDGRFICDICNEHIPAGATARGCRICNFDICNACVNGNHADPDPDPESEPEDAPLDFDAPVDMSLESADETEAAPEPVPEPVPEPAVESMKRLEDILLLSLAQKPEVPMDEVVTDPAVIEDAQIVEAFLEDQRSTQPVNKEIRYTTEMNTMVDMGFTDVERNQLLLIKCGGNVERVFEELQSFESANPEEAEEEAAEEVVEEVEVVEPVPVAEEDIDMEIEAEQCPVPVVVPVVEAGDVGVESAAVLEQYLEEEHAKTLVVPKPFRFVTELDMMLDMGYADIERNQLLLIQCGGNVERVFEELQSLSAVVVEEEEEEAEAEDAEDVPQQCVEEVEVEVEVEVEMEIEEEEIVSPPPSVCSLSSASVSEEFSMELMNVSAIESEELVEDKKFEEVVFLYYNQLNLLLEMGFTNIDRIQTLLNQYNGDIQQVIQNM